MKLSNKDLLDFMQQIYVILITLTMIFSYFWNFSMFILSVPCWIIFKVITYFFMWKQQNLQDQAGTTTKSKIPLILQALFSSLRMKDIKFFPSVYQSVGFSISIAVFFLYQEGLLWSQLGKFEVAGRQVSHNISQEDAASKESFLCCYSSPVNTECQVFSFKNPTSDPSATSIKTAQAIKTLDNQFTSCVFLSQSLQKFLQQQHKNINSEQYQSFPWFNLFFTSQVLWNLLLKGVFELFILVTIMDEPLENHNFFQFLSLFVSISSCQGLLGIIYHLRYEVFYYVLLLKCVCLIVEMFIIWFFKMEFFECDPQRPYEAGALITVVDLILNYPIDYSPFYAQSWTGDFKQMDLSTQPAIFIVRTFQTLETACVLFLTLCIPQQGIFLQFLIDFFRISAIISLFFQSFNVYKQLRAVLLSDYQFLKKEFMKLDELMKIMKNSKKLIFLDVNSLTDYYFTLYSDKKTQKQLLKLTLTHLSQTTQVVSLHVSNIINSQGTMPSYLTLSKENPFLNAFFELLADPTHQIPFCQYQDVRADESLLFKFQSALINRIYKNGLSNDMNTFLSCQYESFQSIGYTTVKTLESNIMATILFKQEIAPFLFMNPVQALHDIWYED